MFTVTRKLFSLHFSWPPPIFILPICGMVVSEPLCPFKVMFSLIFFLITLFFPLLNAYHPAVYIFLPFVSPTKLLALGYRDIYTLFPAVKPDSQYFFIVSWVIRVCGEGRGLFIQSTIIISGRNK